MCIAARPCSARLAISAGCPEIGKKEYTKDTAAQRFSASNVGFEILRYEIQHEYTEVANTPDKGFHFHTGRGLAKMLE